MVYDCHNHSKKLDMALRTVRKDKEIEANRSLLLKFHNYCVAQGLSHGRLARCLYNMRALARMIKIPFDKMDRDSIVNLMVILEGSKYADSSKGELKCTFKKFYKWMKKDDSPKEIAWIKNGKKKSTKRPEDMLSEDEIKNMIDNAGCIRDKTIISILYESGIRVGELFSLQIKHVTFDKYGAKLSVTGKTGPRVVRVIASVPYLTEWLNEHPRKNNAEFPLWISNWHGGQILSYSRLKNMLKQVAKRAGVTKRVHAHLFRHSRATYLANHLTESQMKAYLGWEQDSRMAAVYVHLSNRDVDNAILGMNGVVVEKKKEDSGFAPKDCIRCDEVNPPTNKFCKKCGMVLDKQEMIAVVEKDMERTKADEIMDKLLEDGEFKKLFMEKVRDMTDLKMS
jgi:integrase